MASIATLTIDLIAKSGKLTSELAKANKKTKSWADDTRKMVNSATKVMVGMGVAGVAALSAIYVKNAAFIDQQAKTADRLGITTEALTGLQHAASINGATNEELNKSLQTMQKNLGQVAQTGTGEAKDALEGLGLSATELKGLKPEEQFKLIAEKLKNVEDQSQKVYIAQTLMGKSGTKMINVMANGADGIQALMTEADELGITFSRIDAAKVEMANDAFERAEKSTHSFGQVLATETAPLVGALADMWTDSSKEAGGFGAIAQNVVTKVASGIGFLADMGRGLQVTFLLVKQAFAEVINGVVQGINEAAQYSEGFLEFLGMDTSSLKTMDSFAQSFEHTTSQMGDNLQSLLDEPMPSSKIENWVSDVQTKFQAAAEEQVNNGKKTNLSELLLDDSGSVKPTDDNKKEDLEKSRSQQKVERVRSEYQQIFDAQLALEGKEAELANRKYERKRLEMEQEYELLREKNLITTEIDTEYRTAKEQLELQHQANLTNIEKEQQDLQAEGYSNLLGVIGSYYDGMEGKQSGYARTAISLGQTMLDEEKRNSLQSIWANTYDTAMKAYNALASIPIVGPVLGSIAAGTVLGAGAMYAGKVSGLSSFDGGGYTGDGARIGGVDGKGGMYAIVHPQETIVDHTKGQSTSNQQVALNYNFYGSAQENESMINRNRNATIRDARRLSNELSRPY